MAVSGPGSTGAPAWLRGAVAAVTGLLVVTLAGCGGDDDVSQARASASASPSADAGAADAPRQVQGGEPGEEAQEVEPDATVPANQWSPDDETFMSAMIPHHAQALEMTALVPARTDDPRVRRLAERIEAAQGPEIMVMAAWLDERGLPVPRRDDDHAGHQGHDAMAGMLTAGEMAELARSRGRAFDRLFLTSMIRHHEGALEMADDTAGGGLDVLVGEHRDEVTSTQGAEVERMQRLLARL